MIGLVRDEVGSSVLEAFGGLLDAHHDLARTRKMRTHPTGYDDAFWKRLADAGWLGARVPERDGGSGLSATATAVIHDMAGTRLLPDPYLAGGYLPAAVLAGCPAGAERDAALGALLAGERRFAVAWQERPGRVEAADELETVLHRGRVTGRKRFVSGAAGAGALLATVSNDEGVAHIVLIDAAAHGVEGETTRQVDGSMVSDLRFTDAPIVADLGPASVLEPALDEARVAAAAQLLGIAREALRVTIDYAGTRRQFGRPIGAFQALQHRMADFATRIRLGEVACDDALRAIDAAEPDRRRTARLAAAAKASAADAAVQVTQGAIQIHGAIGYTDEADVGLFLLAALRLSPWLGTPEILRERFLELGGVAGDA